MQSGRTSTQQALSQSSSGSHLFTHPAPVLHLLRPMSLFSSRGKNRVADPDTDPDLFCRIRIRNFRLGSGSCIHNYLNMKNLVHFCQSLSKLVFFKLMDYKYLTKFINLGVKKAMRHHKFNDDEIDWYILLSRIRIRSGLC
jgi:hypothetical protein